jgi:hypothetical protein
VPKSAGRAVALLLFAVPVIAGCVVRSVNQPPGACVEPQPLCGEWAGPWDSDGDRREAYLTVRRVAGRDVEGLAFIRGSVPYHDMDLPFTGTFDGKDLLGAIHTGPGKPAVTWQLELDPRGAELKGRGFSGVWSDLYLVKRR